MTSKLAHEIERYLQSARQKHEHEEHQVRRARELLAAHRESLLSGIRALRQEQSEGLADIHLELQLFASEIGLLPSPSPQPLDLSAPMAMPRLYRNASEDLAQSIN